MFELLKSTENELHQSENHENTTFFDSGQCPFTHFSKTAKSLL